MNLVSNINMGGYCGKLIMYMRAKKIYKGDFVMVDILVHGLGQDETSWNEVINKLKNSKINAETTCH